jgi:hypothetical protein
LSRDIGVVGSYVGSTLSTTVHVPLRHRRRHPAIPHPATLTLSPIVVRAPNKRELHKPRRFSQKSDELHDPRIIPPDSSTHISVKMPSEVSDIKQFIEICRRKDAKCMFYLDPTRQEEEREDLELCSALHLGSSMRLRHGWKGDMA